MRILFVSLFLPQAKAYHAGGRFVFEIIRHLSEKHEIHLVTRLEENELPTLEDLKPFCKKIYPYTYRTVRKRGILDAAALVLNYTGFSRYANRLAQSGLYDVVQVEWTEAALLMKKGNTPMVLDAHDVISKPAERRAARSRGLKRIFHRFLFLLIKNREVSIVKRFERVFTHSDYDRKYLQSLAPKVRAEVIPHPAGLDITDRKLGREKNTILFLASYKYRRVNVDAALYFYHKVFPLVRREVPDATFIIAGYGPPAELTSLAEKDPAVMVRGFVEDIDECYKTAAVFVAPILIGGGIIVKVLDAFAAGTPVVTTSYGNEGIGAEPGRDLLVADDPESFSGAVVRLLTDDRFAGEIAENARAFAQKNFGLSTVMQKIESTYNEIVRRKTIN